LAKAVAERLVDALRMQAERGKIAIAGKEQGAIDGALSNDDRADSRLARIRPRGLMTLAHQQIFFHTDEDETISPILRNDDRFTKSFVAHKRKVLQKFSY
jgi:hypothetical protein